MGWFEDALGGGMFGALPATFGQGLDNGIAGLGGGLGAAGLFNSFNGMQANPVQGMANPQGAAQDYSQPIGPTQPQAAQPTQANQSLQAGLGLLGQAAQPQQQPQMQQAPHPQVQAGHQVQLPQQGMLSQMQFQHPRAFG